MKSKNKNIIPLLSFIAEAGILKYIPRSGWLLLGIKQPESVAEHSFRCAIIGYLLACMEESNAEKVLIMTLFNDIHEARITDMHKMAQRYINATVAEDKSFSEQMENLPNKIGTELLGLRAEYKRQKTKESIISRDADILECLIQAKEYYDKGFRQAKDFMKKAPRFLKTSSARTLWKQTKTRNINIWWHKFSDFKR